MENEKRLIDANALKDNFGFLRKMWSETEISATIDEEPTVDAVEVVHGRWVDRWGGKYANPHYVCSVCKKPALYKCDLDVLSNGLWSQDLTDYCPNCGAKMDGERKDNDNN